MARERRPIDTDNLVRRYTAGESCQDLARVFGVSDSTLRRRLTRRGVAIRQGPSYAKPPGEDEAIRRAQERERTLVQAGPHEAVFAQLLADVGLETVPQRALGPYNVDFALVVAPIAVEVVAGSGNRRACAGRTERIQYLLERGWWVVEVRVRQGPTRYAWSRAAAEYLVTLADVVGPTPSGRGQHRVIRADGQLVALRRMQVH